MSAKTFYTLAGQGTWYKVCTASYKSIFLKVISAIDTLFISVKIIDNFARHP